MTKKIQCILLTLVMVLSIAPVTAFAEDDILSYLTYEIIDGEVTITDCDTSISGDVVIPDTIEGYPVTAIGDNSFELCGAVTSIVIPDGVKTIGDSAIFDCWKLQSVKIGNGVTTIGESAFSYCTNIDGIFIPESVKSIGDNSFYRCDNLEFITVDDNNLYYSSDNYGVFFNKDKTELIRYPGNCSKTEYVIPDSVTTINDAAFAFSNVKSVTISDNVEIIGESAFYWCENFESVIIEDGVKTIGNDAFRICESLVDLVIPDSVTTIGENAFDWCTGLESVIIGNGVTTISNSAFEDCYALKSVIIGNSVTTIGDAAFCDCSSLINIVIPDSVTTIGDAAFFGCSSLASVTIGKLVTTIGDEAFYDCSSLINIVIPDSVTAIGVEAFLGCSSLESVTIGKGVTSIGEQAFKACTSLSKIDLPERAIMLSWATFTNTAYYNDEKNWENGVLYIGKHLIATEMSVVSEKYVVKDGTKSIAAGGFYDCALLTEISIPDSVEYIGDGAFTFCTALKEIVLPKGLKAIFSGTFANCYLLENIVIPDGVTYVGEAFAGCYCLKNISFSDSVQYFDNYVIYTQSILDIYVYNPDAEFSPETIIPFGIYFKNTTVEEAMALWSAYSAAEVSGQYTSDELIKMAEDMEFIIGDIFETTDVDYTIHGYEGSTAETYAKEHGFKFVPICDHVNTETINAKNADCLNEGYTGDVYCNDCEEIISNGETIPSTGHNYIENIIKEPTYSQDGTKNSICENCGDTTAEENIPMLKIEDSEIIKDENNDVSVIFPENAFEGNVEITVTPVPEGDAYKLISHKQGNYKVTMFDINVTVNGENVQPGGTVLVKIPLPKGYNQNKCVVYYVADDGTMEELKTYHYKDGYVYFETDHFSYYAIIEDVEDVPSEDDNADNSQSFIDKLIAFFNMIVDFFRKLFGMA